MTTRAHEIRERLAVALDYIRVAPLNMLDAWDGRGKGGLSDRDMMWELPPEHTIRIGDKTKEQFREAADLLLEEIGVPILLARVEELEKDHRAMERAVQCGIFVEVEEGAACVASYRGVNLTNGQHSIIECVKDALKELWKPDGTMTEWVRTALEDR